MTLDSLMLRNITVAISRLQTYCPLTLNLKQRPKQLPLQQLQQLSLMQNGVMMMISILMLTLMMLLVGLLEMI